MVFGIFHRMVLGELAVVSLYCLLIVLGSVVTFDIGKEVVLAGFAGWRYAASLGSLLVIWFPTAVPMSLCLSHCFVFGRMASANEIGALKALGIRVQTILLPAVLIGALAGGCLLHSYNTAIPSAAISVSSIKQKPRVRSEPRTEEMSLTELYKRRDALARELRGGREADNSPDEPSPRENGCTAIMAIELEVHLRLATSSGCLFFAVLGALVGARCAPASPVLAFFCSLPIVAVYYSLYLISGVLAGEGVIRLPCLLWSPHLALAIIGAAFYRSVTRN
jgi:lipopolysaccharide export LptBFGC system permease protein LptF